MGGVWEGLGMMACAVVIAKQYPTLYRVGMGRTEHREMLGISREASLTAG